MNRAYLIGPLARTVTLVDCGDRESLAPVYAMGCWISRGVPLGETSIRCLAQRTQAPISRLLDSILRLQWQHKIHVVSEVQCEDATELVNSRSIAGDLGFSGIHQLLYCRFPRSES